jgi:tetratricopeptide (TPR) repeat protein
MRSCLCVMVTALLTAGAVWPQRQENWRLPVRGEIVTSHPVVGTLTVELSSNGVAPSESVTVQPDGTFEFRSASPGVHELRVIAANGQLLHQESVNITNSGETLSIRLPDTPDANRSTDSVVSLQQLRHKVPPAARKAYEKGEQAIAKGKLPEARGLFQEAVTIDPEFCEAYNNLGGVEADMKQLPEAAEHFQKAIELVPEHPRALPNLAIVLAKMLHWREAGQVARRAMRVVPGDARMNYVLAASLLTEPSKHDEALEQFERAAAAIPSAHVRAAELLAERGRSDEAIRHLETYLASAPAGDSLRPRAEADLAALHR